MREIRLFLTALLLATTVQIHAQQQDDNTASDLMELEVIASPREEGAMRRQPASASLIDSKQLQDMQATSLKSISTFAPNFYMPDYGSHLSSAVYIRGIGSRINSPAIGLYIDDVPVLDKSAFDFGLFDMQRVDILRGPQSTLYGAGTMGGVMKAYSISPFTHQGTDISLGYATNDNTRKFGIMHYSKLSERVAWSFGGYYVGGDGFFRNDYTGEKVDDTQYGGIRFRVMAETKRNWLLDFAANYEINNEGAYPYYYVGKQGGTEDKADQLYRINNNLRGIYDRDNVRVSMKVSKDFKAMEFKSITSFQALNDSMQMDQDLLSDDIYKLTQVQSNKTVTQDFLLKSRRPGHWQWITGATGSFLHNNITAPVTFRQDGVAMLNQMVNKMAGANMPTVQAGVMTMAFNFDDQIQGNEVKFNGKYTINTLSAGIFHQSTIHDLFNVQGLSVTAGLRFNADIQNLQYASWYKFSHIYQLSGHLTMPSGERDITMVPAQEYKVANGFYSSNYDAATTKGIVAQEAVNDTHYELMPRFALQYEIEKLGNFYATVSRGYRTGGYNVQNISEVMRSLMIRDMMTNVRDATLPVMEAQAMVPQATKDQVSGILNGMANSQIPDVAQSVKYAPEYTWNYEVGTHLNLRDGRLYLDASAFLCDIQDLQLSQMSETGLGRIMVNAGKARSAGMELMLKAHPNKNLLLQANYGYTHATFRDYTDYDANTKTLVDCKGKYVPFMPQHTVNLDIAYTVEIDDGRPAYEYSRNSFIPRTLTIGANYSGAGRIYWTEQNDATQDYYSMLGARVTLDMHPLTLALWGHNLTNSNHNTFWFVSANRAYEQHVKPIQFGIDAKFSF